MGRVPYVCPDTHEPVTPSPIGLQRADNRIYSWVGDPNEGHIPDFLDLHEVGAGSRTSLAMYDSAAGVEVYRNFLDWLFATFRTSEAEFRQEMVSRLRAGRGDAVLITGCGLGGDIPYALAAVGESGEVYAQDLSPAMVLAARASLAAVCDVSRVSFSVGDAKKLPFADGSFDAAFHFGGINLFDDVRAGVGEMARVVRPGGRVVVSDEGVAPWLRGTDYADMVITNNRLWAHEAPIGLLPQSASDVVLSWVLGACFWVIEFEVAAGLPEIDPHVTHKGRRGGSMWTRHKGKLEAVTPETRELVEAAAEAAGLSVHDWLERVLASAAGAPQ